ncbi:tetratricopeptide repeat protein [Pseudomethylobacillus aquaticus]|uniref:Tetratricopeptide repeat protein n=1 Tax=Pseudomethylobacillus aquaticus TaxID=2676064 RepID=A0A3N0V760_9PROT|nr:tetratricopeptide repeat protein [Pseudomethylobacillus aquaticus]ROH88452.1 tetratricopeptide repeat protein [Pseudomethylobacillus aquaticus]
MPLFQPLSLNSARTSLLLLALLYSAGALAEPASKAEVKAEVKTEAKPAAMVMAKPELSGEFVYKYLVGEIAGQRGDASLAGSVFMDLAKSSRDARLAERAAKAAVQGQNAPLAVQASQLWSDLDPDSIEANQVSTQVLVSVGRLSAAKPHLQKLLLKPDTRANGFLYLNGLLSGQPDKQAVLNLMEELAKPYQDLPEARFSVAHAAWSNGLNTRALDELKAAEQLRPGWELSAMLQGQILAKQQAGSAMSFYDAFLQKYPASDEVRMAYARLLVSQKQIQAAKTQFVKLLESSKGSPEALVVVGLLSLQLEDMTEAERYFKQSLEAGYRDPDQLYIYLGQLNERRQELKQAIAWYQKVQPGERLLAAKLSIASITARLEGTNAGIAQLDSLEKLNTEQEAVVQQAKANLLMQAKRHEESYAVLENAVSTLPNTPELIYDYAMAAERLQKMDVAERELRKLILIKPDFAQAYNALGYSWADRNIKLEEARKLIEKALELSPDDHYIMDSMGWVMYRLGKLDTAADYLRRAYTAQADPEIAAHLGEVLWQQGKRDEAVRTWEDALRAHPENEVLNTTRQKFKQAL